MWALGNAGHGARGHWGMRALSMQASGHAGFRAHGLLGRHAGLRACGLWGTWALGHVGFESCGPWCMRALRHAMRPLGYAGLEANGPWGLRSWGYACLRACGPWRMQASRHAVIFCCPEREPCEDRLCWFAYLLQPYWFKQVIILLVAPVRTYLPSTSQPGRGAVRELFVARSRGGGPRVPNLYLFRTWIFYSQPYPGPYYIFSLRSAP